MPPRGTAVCTRSCLSGGHCRCTCAAGMKRSRGARLSPCSALRPLFFAASSIVAAPHAGAQTVGWSAVREDARVARSGVRPGALAARKGVKKGASDYYRDARAGYRAEYPIGLARAALICCRMPRNPWDKLMGFKQPAWSCERPHARTNGPRRHPPAGGTGGGCLQGHRDPRREQPLNASS
jgi:hypothetical protein